MAEERKSWMPIASWRTVALIPIAATFWFAALSTIFWFQGDYPLWLLMLPASLFATATMALRGRLPAPTIRENGRG